MPRLRQRREILTGMKQNGRYTREGEGEKENRDCDSPGTGSEHQTRQPAKGELEDSVYKIYFLIPQRWPPCYMDFNAAKPTRSRRILETKISTWSDQLATVTPLSQTMHLARPHTTSPPQSVNQGVFLLSQQRQDCLGRRVTAAALKLGDDARNVLVMSVIKQEPETIRRVPLRIDLVVRERID